LAHTLGLDDRLLARGIAIADTDGDGKLDFAVANQWNDSFYFHNESPAKNAYLNLHIVLPLDESSAANLETIQEGHPAANIAYRRRLGQKRLFICLTDANSMDRLTVAADTQGNAAAICISAWRPSVDMPLELELSWRDHNGTVRAKTIKIKPGVYTIPLVQE